MNPPPRAEHQTMAIREVVNRTSLILALGTGTGKTRIMLEAIAFLRRLGDTPVLILAPASVCDQWIEEAARWLGAEYVARRFVKCFGISRAWRLQRLAGMRGESGIGRIVLLPHEDLSYKPIADALLRIRWGAVFVDESSRFRNNSKRTRALVRLGKVARRRYVASGTMIVKSPMDAWYPVQFVDPMIFADYRGKGARDAYARTFCILGGFTGREPLASRPDRHDDFNALLDPHRLQLSLSDVRDMPLRTLATRRVSLYPEQARAYAELRDTLRLEIEAETGESFATKASTYVARMQRLQEIAAGFARNITGEVHWLPSPKLDEIMEMLADPTPTIVWTLWRPEQLRLIGALRDAGLPFADLDHRDQFLDGRKNILVAQVAAGGYGLNLERASRMIYASLPWDLDVYLQSQERNWRMTTRDSKLVVHVVAQSTVDEYVRDRLLAKSRSASALSRSDALRVLGLQL